MEFVERDIPEPGAGQVRVKVEACGICHSDVLVKDGLWPGLQYPRVPGHEVAGRIDAVGGGVTEWTAASASALAGTADIVSSANNAGAAISRCASIARLRASISTAGMPNTCSRPRRRWRRFPMNCRRRKRGRSCAPASPFTTRCAIQARAAATSWPCTASAGSDISACSMRGRWDS